MIAYIGWDRERLPDLCKLWNKGMGGRFPMRAELFWQNSFEDPNLLKSASWIAVEEATNQVVGFVAAKVWQDGRSGIRYGERTGWIQAILVDPACRNRGIGTTLLRKAEDALKEKGMDKILLGRDPWHYFPGIPEECEEAREWFEQKGYRFTGTIEYDLYLNLADERFELPRFEGVTFRLLNEGEGGRLIGFLHSCFSGRWEYEAIQYFERGGTGREFVVAEKACRIIGFCRINDGGSPVIGPNVAWAPLFAGELGGIGPLGIDPEERKQGYGLGIVQAAVCFLQQRGIRHLVIDWTGLTDFYGKLGFRPWKKYLSYMKKIG